MTICRLTERKKEGVRLHSLLLYTGKAPGWRCCAPEALHVISSALSLYHTCGMDCKHHLRGAPPWGGREGGRKGRLNL